MILLCAVRGKDQLQDPIYKNCLQWKRVLLCHGLLVLQTKCFPEWIYGLGVRYPVFT